MSQLHFPHSLRLLILVVLLALGLVRSAAAQTPSLAVSIIGVDNSRFPQMSASVTVADETGIPVVGLTEADFQLSEDQSALPEAGLRVESSSVDNLRLVLVLDTSAEAAAFPQIQATAKALIDSMGPLDKMAIIAFDEDVRLIQRNFTNNKDSLKAALDSLSPRGVTKKTGEAVLEGATLAANDPDGRGVVILLTDSGNVNRVGEPQISDQDATPSTQVLDGIEAAQIPIYMITFGSVRTPPLRAITDRTVGQIYRVIDVSDVQPTLRILGVALRESYRLSWESAQPADNAAHDLLVTVNAQGQQAEAQSSFIAQAGQVSVTLPGVEENQLLAGSVTLTPLVTAPAPITSVEYLLDGEPLGESINPPFTFTWDSTTITPRGYTLTVRARDAAGNVGELARRIEVAGPIEVDLTLSAATVQSGREVTADALVDASVDVRTVEFFVDDRSVGTVTTPPYRLVLNSGEYEAGTRTVTARVVDTVGRTGEALATVRVFAFNWWTLLYLLVLLILTVLLLALIVAWSRIIPRRQFAMELSNLSNTRSRYELGAEDALGALDFEFRSKNVVLRRKSIQSVEVKEPVVEVQPVMAAVPVEATANGAQYQMPQAPQVPKMQAPNVPKPPNPGFLLNITRVIVMLLSSVAYILPFGLGRPLNALASTLRQGELVATRTQGLGTQLASAGQQLAPAQPAPMTPSMSGTKPPAMPAAAATMAAPTMTAVAAPPVAVAQPRGGNNRRKTTSQIYRTEKVEKYQDVTIARLNLESPIETPYVEPGGTYSYFVLVRPKRPFSRGDYNFTITAKAIESKDDPSMLIEGGLLELSKVPLYHLYLPLLLFALTIVLASVFAFLLLTSGLA